MGSEMKIEIPTQLIEDVIRSEMIRQIPEKDRDKLIKSVVEHAMSAKKDSYSDTPTFFQQAVNNMIVEEATKIFREWLDNNREVLTKALFTYLNAEKQKRMAQFCKNLIDNINKYQISVNLVLDGKKYD